MGDDVLEGRYRRIPFYGNIEWIVLVTVLSFCRVFTKFESRLERLEHFLGGFFIEFFIIVVEEFAHDCECFSVHEEVLLLYAILTFEQ